MPALPWILGGGVLLFAGVNYTADNLTENSAKLIRWGLLGGAGYAAFLAAKKAKVI